MNIEEERKAFEQIAKQKGVNVVRTSVAMMFANGKRMRVGDYFEPAYTAFEFWVQAKQHAEEMLKPVAEVWERMDDKFWAVKEGRRSNVCENGSTFQTYSDAVQCAKERGYRVVEE